MKEVEGLMTVYRSCDFYDFMDEFFLNRFPDHKQRATDSEKGLIRARYFDDSYAREKWRSFQKNPVFYMCHMDKQTLAEFEKAILRRMGDPI